MKNEKGLALLASLLLMFLVTTLGMIVANKGTLLQSSSQTTSRYEEITAAAEISMRQAISALAQTRDRVDVVNVAPTEVINPDSAITSVWDPIALRAAFTEGAGGVSRTNFTNFRATGWAATALTDNILTSYGSITTYTIIEEMLRTDLSDADGYTSQFLVTVKAGARDEDLATAREKEKIVLQSVYEMTFVGRGN